MTGIRIALIGYGKMGKIIHRVAEERGHHVVLKVDLDKDDISQITPDIDVAIEFTRPEAVVSNLKACFQYGVPVVCGTTGWLEHWAIMSELCYETKGGLFYASNYSIGVNIFFHLNQVLASIMNKYDEYDVDLKEIHHTQKLDAPSGTAITLAEGVLSEIHRKSNWVNHEATNPDELSILSERIRDVPGTHSVHYRSSIDDIEIKHTAHSREGFALGAIVAAEWLVGKVGVFGMRDMLKIQV